MLRSMNPSHGVLWTTGPPANLLDWQAQAKSFEAIAGYRWWTVDLTGGDLQRATARTPHHAGVLQSSRRAVDGQTFDLEHDRSQRRRPEIIIGRGLWQRRFGSDARLLGKVVDINIINLSRVGPTPSLVVGIALADVHFPPLSADLQSRRLRYRRLRGFLGCPSLSIRPGVTTATSTSIARLRPGVSLEQAQAEMDAISRNLAAAHPETNNGLSVRVVPLRDQVLGGSRRVLFLLFACTGFVLLVACGNVANLLLARAAARQKEVAIRVALWRCEDFESCGSFWPSPVDCAAGRRDRSRRWPMAAVLLRPLIPAGVPLAQDATVDRTVLLFTVFVASFTALLVTGIVPAFRVRIGTSGRRHEARRTKLHSRTRA